MARVLRFRRQNSGLTVIAAVSTVAFTQIASAADLPRKAPAYTPPPAPVVSRIGFYVGVGVGARWMDSDWITTAAFDPGGGLIPFSTDPNASFSDMPDACWYIAVGGASLAMLNSKDIAAATGRR